MGPNGFYFGPTGSQSGGGGGGDDAVSALTLAAAEALDNARQRRILIDDNDDGLTHVVSGGTVASVSIALPAWAQLAHTIEGRVQHICGGGGRFTLLQPNGVATTDFLTKFIGSDSIGSGVFTGNYDALLGAIAGGGFGPTEQIIYSEFSLQMRAAAKWQMFGRSGGRHNGNNGEASNAVVTGHKATAWAAITSITFGSNASEFFNGSTIELWAVFE